MSIAEPTITTTAARILTTGRDAKHNPKIGHSVQFWLDSAATPTRPALLYLVPSKMSGVDLCWDASPDCRRVCSVNPRKGFGKFFPEVEAARQRTTREFLDNPEAFLHRLSQGLDNEIRLAERQGAIVVARLNMSSDIDWLSMSQFYGVNLFGELGYGPRTKIQFYDYSKKLSHLKPDLPPNYHITFSRSEVNSDRCAEAHKRGHNVAVVFANGRNWYGSKKAYQQTLPETWNLPGIGELPVIDGDIQDYRCFDRERGAIVGLRMKGDKKDFASAIDSGFAVLTAGGAA